MYSKKQKNAIEMWNVATGGSEDAPATAFAGIAVGRGAVKYIPRPEKDFTAGNVTEELHRVTSFLQEWIKELWDDE